VLKNKNGKRKKKCVKKKIVQKIKIKTKTKKQCKTIVPTTLVMHLANPTTKQTALSQIPLC
jgi:hypothetical protein